MIQYFQDTNYDIKVDIKSFNRDPSYMKRRIKCIKLYIFIYCARFSQASKQAIIIEFYKYRDRDICLFISVYLFIFIYVFLLQCVKLACMCVRMSCDVCYVMYYEVLVTYVM